MGEYDLKLLDCTLRDGGYVNEWKWGFQQAREIIHTLIKANVDIVEVGFLKNVKNYDPDITVCNRIEELNRLLPNDNEKTMFSAMAMRSDYDISMLSPYNGHGIEMIRITAHDYDIKDGMDFAYKVKEKGYKLSINPINIMGYTDAQILWILEQVNKIQPYQFSIVDTFGSMKRRDLERIVSLVDNNLNRSVRVALHLHENMSMSCYLAQNFIDKHLNRPISVDCSLMGMGRIPGNLPIELIADYINDYIDKTYDIDYIMDLIQDYIAPLKGSSQWGYTPAYFLSARFNLHRNYAEHYLKKGDLTNRDINHILARIDRSKANAFELKYADLLYEDYKNNRMDDTAERNNLKRELEGRDILIIAPGMSIKTYKNLISEYILANSPITISTNFIPLGLNYKIDFCFFSNSKRFDKIEKTACKVIATSNLSGNIIDFHIDFNSLTGAFEQGCNSFIMLLKLLKEMNVKNITVAGADGYTKKGINYYDSTIRNYSEHDFAFNMAVSEAIKCLGVKVDFITPSEYENVF